MTPFLDVFREEAHELLVDLETALLELEAGTGEDAAGRVFRALHTLKGSGAMAGFTSVAMLVHEIESAFELVRCGYLPVERELISLTLKVRDRVNILIAGESTQLLDAADHALIAAVCTFIARADGAGQTGADHPATAEELPTYRILFRPPADIFRRGINPLGLLQELERLGRCTWRMQIDAIPPLDAFDAESCYFSWDITLATAADENAFAMSSSLWKRKAICASRRLPVTTIRYRLSLAQARLPWPPVLPRRRTQHLPVRRVKSAPPFGCGRRSSMRWSIWSAKWLPCRPGSAPYPTGAKTRN